PDELLGERSVRALGNERVFPPQLHAAGEAVLRLTIPADAHVACCDANDPALLVLQDLRCRKPRIDLYSKLRCLLAKPTNQVPQADDVIAVIVHPRRHQEVWQPQLTCRTEIHKSVLGDWGGYGGAPLPPIRDESIK